MINLIIEILNHAKFKSKLNQEPFSLPKKSCFYFHFWDLFFWCFLLNSAHVWNAFSDHKSLYFSCYFYFYFSFFSIAFFLSKRAPLPFSILSYCSFSVFFFVIDKIVCSHFSHYWRHSHFILIDTMLVHNLRKWLNILYRLISPKTDVLISHYSQVELSTNLFFLKQRIKRIQSIIKARLFMH